MSLFSNKLQKVQRAMLDSDITNELDTHTSQLAETEKYINVQKYGAKLDGVSDDTQAILSAISDIPNYPINSTLLIPSSNGCVVTQTIYIPSTVNVIMKSPIIYDGIENIPALVIGTSSSIILMKNIEVMVTRKNQSLWDNENCIGVKIFNANTSTIKVIQASKFTIGVQAIGSGNGFAYNHIDLGYIYDNKISLDVTNEGNGWVNENTWNDGRYGRTSTTNITLIRIGIRITSKDGLYKTNNNNVFNKPSIEMNIAIDADSIPILIEHGKLNTFNEIRNDGVNTFVARILNDSLYNLIKVGYGLSIIDDQTIQSTQVSESKTEIYRKTLKPIYTVKNIHKKTCYYDGNTKFHTPRMNRVASDGSVILSQVGGTIYDKYMELTTAMGLFIKTKKSKKFNIKLDDEINSGARIAIKPYDSNGNLIDGSGLSVPVVGGFGLNWSTNFGGSYYLSADGNGEMFFSINSVNVDYILLIINKGVTNTIKLRSVSVYSDNETDVWTGFEGLHDGENVGTTYPTAGTWTAGRTVYNATPASGGYLGWVCTVGGTPGTWKGFGLIQA